jgi:CrcB protein
MVIAGAGSAGAVVRYAVGLALPAATGRFPWNTFTVNITGSFAIGLVLVLLTERFPVARVARPLIVTGFLGGYTTFSTYMVDTIQLVRLHDYLTGGVYVTASTLAGTAAVIMGALLARFLIRLDHAVAEQVKT